MKQGATQWQNSSLRVQMTHTITARQVTELTLSPRVNPQRLSKSFTNLQVLSYIHQKPSLVSQGPNSRCEDRTRMKHALIMEVAISELTVPEFTKVCILLQLPVIL